MLSLLIGGVASGLVAQSLSEKAKNYFEAAYAASQFSGAAQVARGDEVLFQTAQGYASIELEVPNQVDTRFRLGSITKQITALAILQLVDQRKLSLDGKITDYLKDYPAEPQGKVTIHQLLNHTSGIPSYTGIDSIMGRRGSWPADPWAIVPMIQDLPLEFEPGSEYRYNNSGYHLLGLILERVSGQPYDVYLREHIFEPLGMADTGFEHYQEVVPGLARGYVAIGENPMASGNIVMDIPYSAGSLYSTVGDLHRWHEALTAGKLISEESYARMFTPYLSGYGYGVVMDSLFGHPRIMHGGGIDGFSTFTMRMDDDDLYISVLANLESAQAGKFAHDLAAMVYGEDYEVPEVKKVVKVDPSLYDRYTGTYNLFPDFDLTISREDDKLYAQATGQVKFQIQPESETVFFTRAIPGATIEFLPVEGEEKVQEMILHQNGDHKGTRID